MWLEANTIPASDRGRYRSAFTIVEILVVISVIAVLIALLLPAMGAAKESARGVQCLSQERQIHAAISAYTADSLGLLPISSYAFCSHNETSDPWYPQNHNSALWAAVVARYTGNRYITEFRFNEMIYPDVAIFLGYGGVPKPNQGILGCPSENSLNTWGSDLAVSYGYNGHSWGMGVNDFFNVHWVDAYSGNETYKRAYGRIRFADVAKTATTVLLADEKQDGGYEYAGYHFNDGPADLATYHNGAGNVLWADGHATPRKPEAMTNEDFDRRM